MWLLASAVGLSALIAGTLLARSLLQPLPTALIVPVGAAVAIALEAVVVHALSAAGALGRTGVVVAHVLLLSSSIVLARARFRRRWVPSLRGITLPYRAAPAAAILVAVVAVLVTLSAVEWLPNNWDSMTYRLARVAHWIERGSVGAYPTSIARQNVLPPGTEYLVLVLQLVAGSDALANLPQLGAWLMLAFSLPALARTLGAPRLVAPWAGPLFACAPMAALQAPTTQNDLMAALMAVAVVVTCLPFLHRNRRWRATDVALSMAVGAAAALVKPTAVVAAVGIAGFAVAGCLRSLRRSPGSLRGLARGVAAGTCAAALILAPFVLAAASDSRTAGASEAFVYPLAGEFGDRAVNVVRGAVRHLPLPQAIADGLASTDSVPGCDIPGRLCAESMLRLHEDYAGNPGQAILVLMALALAVARWRFLARRSRVAVVALALAWTVFHFTFRDNVWISRLQVPLFAIASIAALAACSALPRRRPTIVAVGALVTLVSAHGALAAARTEARPPLLAPGDLAQARSPAAYYTTAPRGLGQLHDAVLWATNQERCPRLGLIIGGDSYDYPLTWRAMQAGTEVRHVDVNDDWACAIFSDRDGLPLGNAWAASEIPGLFFRREATVRMR